MSAIPTVETVVMVPIGSIHPYERNPRRNDATIDRLVELIPKVGFNVPLVLDRQNIIVKGHSRWRAAVRLKMKALPCVYTDADAETIKLDRLADNRVQEFSTWDQELLVSELGTLNLPGFDLGLLDFEAIVPGLDLSGTGAGLDDEEPLSEPAAPELAAPEPPPAPAAPAARPEPVPDDPAEIGTRAPRSTVEVSETAFADDQDMTMVVCYNCGKKLFVRPK